MFIEDAKVVRFNLEIFRKKKQCFCFQRDRRSDPALPLTVIDPSEKLLAEKPIVTVYPPARSDLDVDKTRQPVNRVIPPAVTSTQLKRDQISEYQSRYKPIIDQKKPRTRKAFEAEQAEERVND
jgi:hypothetical protein